MLNSYEVIMENKEGGLYRHSCIADSKRMASMAAIQHVDESSKMSVEGYVIIECRSTSSDDLDNFKYEKTEDE